MQIKTARLPTFAAVLTGGIFIARSLVAAHQQTNKLTINIDFYTVITGSAVALHCCNGHSKINRKMGISPPVESQPLKISL